VLPTSDAARTIALAEYDTMRSEINNRTTLAYALISLELAAVGAGVSVLGKLPDVLLGLAAVSSFLWLFWVDHAGAVYKLASYIALELAPKLSTAAGEPMLGWEYFLRRLNKDRDTARAALYGSGATDQPAYIQSTTAADRYTMLLFGGSAPLFIVGYLVTILGEDHHRSALVIWLSAAAVTVLWLFALSRFLGFRRTVENIGAAILARGAPAPSTPPPAGDASA
jgi:hypothetical protein